MKHANIFALFYFYGKSNMSKTTFIYHLVIYHIPFIGIFGNLTIYLKDDSMVK